jgi:hypothetical protein
MPPLLPKAVGTFAVLPFYYNCCFLKPLRVVVALLIRAVFGPLYQRIIAPLLRRC